jgi:hypothetical protein
LTECSHMKLYSDSGGQRGENAIILIFKPQTLYYRYNIVP